MRAAWWWIDRWRQSDAFAQMTAEEQGLYFNLCLEVFARDGAPIPNDDRILAKASGDHEAWSRCREKVLKWMVRVDGGWSNKTALEVLGESKRRSEKQSEYRRRRGHAPSNDSGNGPGNGARNKPQPPDPYQDLISGSLPPQPPAGCGGFSALEYAAQVGKPALTREAQRTLNRWVRGQLSTDEIRRKIDNGDHLPRLPL